MLLILQRLQRAEVPSCQPVPGYSQILGHAPGTAAADTTVAANPVVVDIYAVRNDALEVPNFLLC